MRYVRILIKVFIHGFVGQLYCCLTLVTFQGVNFLFRSQAGVNRGAPFKCWTSTFVANLPIFFFRQQNILPDGNG